MFVVYGLIALLTAELIDLPLLRSTDTRILPWGTTVAGCGNWYWNTVLLSLDVTKKVPL